MKGELSLVGIPGKKDPYPRAVQLILSQILSVEQSQQGGVTGSWDDGASGSPLRRRYQSDLGEGGKSGPLPRATQISLSHILPRPWQGKPPGVGRVGLLVAWRVQLGNLPPVRGRYQSGSQEFRWSGIHTKATQLSC